MSGSITKSVVLPAKTHISLGISPVWSEYSLSAWVLSYSPNTQRRLWSDCYPWRKPWVLSYSLNTQQRLWSDCAHAQADLSLGWAHMSMCWFCHASAQFWSEYSLSAWRNHGSLATHCTHSKRLWSDCMDAQTDLSLSWANMSTCWFCHAAA